MQCSRKLWILLGCITVVVVGAGVGLGIYFSDSTSNNSLQSIFGGSNSTEVPTASPTSPIVSLTAEPTMPPTLWPTSFPTNNPTARPTEQPTLPPTSLPTSLPTSSSSLRPTQLPANTSPNSPTVTPTSQPTLVVEGNMPTVSPTVSASNVTAPTTSQHAQIVRDISPSGGVELDDPDSYQTKALLWLEGSTPLDQYSNEKVIQRYVLACIYHATNQVKNAFTDSVFGTDIPVLPWQNTDGWLTAPDECEWNGLTCDSTGMVTEIDLSANVLTGTMPAETSNLKTLTSLNLQNNYFYNVGDAGNNWLGELTSLEKLLIGSTSFHYDGIPPAIGKLTNLIDFDCSYTLYLGPLRGEIFENMNQLEYLYIGGNSYNASIPESIVSLPNLRFFYAEDCDVIDTLDFMLGMSKIYELWIDDNPRLTGELPTALGSLVTLESFSVTGCGLSGLIPTELGLLTGMQLMWLYGNKFSGEIPSHLGALSDLKQFGVQKNLLTGSMPIEICNRRFGVLQELHADCDGDVFCPTDCCTCCGEDCVV